MKTTTATAILMTMILIDDDIEALVPTRGKPMVRPQ